MSNTICLSDQETQKLVGLSLEAAKRVYQYIRVAVVDNVYQCVTDDMRLDRLNVAIENNIVTRILGYY